ncbi:MAG: GNAT family N-acetyltransferase [Anaerolineae bacterium]|nr:GNAT family N-acetyltransferase [Anaerolineae bacterium]
MPMQLRQATPDERTKCLSLLHDADEDDARTLMTMADPACTTYLAAEGDHLIGAAVLRWDQHEAEIVYIAVAADRRGQGVGKQMIVALMAEARSRGMRAVLVGTANSSIGNIAFYQKCGFRMDHIRRDYFSYLTQPVIEDGIPIRDMIVFRLALD